MTAPIRKGRRMHRQASSMQGGGNRPGLWSSSAGPARAECALLKSSARRATARNQTRQAWRKEWSSKDRPVQGDGTQPLYYLAILINGYFSSNVQKRMNRLMHQAVTTWRCRFSPPAFENATRPIYSSVTTRRKTEASQIFPNDEARYTIINSRLSA